MKFENKNWKLFPKVEIFFGINSLLMLSLGALITIFIFWLAFNSTDLLYDIISLLILIGLSALLATVVVRLIASKSTGGIARNITEANSRRRAISNAFQLLWENRKGIATIAAFLFILSVLKGLIGISELMVSYLELDNLKKQNELIFDQSKLLSAQNKAVDAQTKAALTGTIWQIDQALIDYRQKSANFDLVWKSWGSIGLPGRHAGRGRVGLEEYICSKYDHIFLCDDSEYDQQRLMLINPEISSQILGNAAGDGIGWFASERFSGKSKLHWGTWEPGHDSSGYERSIWTRRGTSRFSNAFIDGLVPTCGVNPEYAKLASPLLLLIEEVERAFLDNIIMEGGQRLGDVENGSIDLKETGAALTRAFDSNDFSLLDLSMEYFAAENDQYSEINAEIIGVLESLITAEISLRDFAKICKETNARIEERISDLEAQRSNLWALLNGSGALPISGTTPNFPAFLDKNVTPELNDSFGYLPPPPPTSLRGTAKSDDGFNRLPPPPPPPPKSLRDKSN